MRLFVSEEVAFKILQFGFVIIKWNEIFLQKKLLKCW